MNKKYNLILSGGGVKSYAHLGVYKYLYESKIEVDEIIGISGGSIIAPFILLRKEPDVLIELFSNSNLQKKVLPFWYIPDFFEVLFYEPSTYRIGEWVESQFSASELYEIIDSKKLKILATRYPTKGQKAEGINLLEYTDLKNSIAASTAISGIFKQHEINGEKYIDGAHWNNAPVFSDFKEPSNSLILSNLGYTGLLENEGGRISKIIRGFEITSFSRLIENIDHWEAEKNCMIKGNLIVINSRVWNINPLKFNISGEEMNELIAAGYSAAKSKFEEISA